MYDPPFGKEWVEIYNRSAEDSVGMEPSSIDIKGWSFSETAEYETPLLITADNLVIEPGEYVVLVSDSAGFAADFCDSCCRIVEIDGWSTYLLNNTGDIVVLFDSNLAMVDSMSYSGTCSDVSLERVKCWGLSSNSDNWECCEEVATPCAVNSVSPIPSDLKIMSAWTNPADPEPNTDFFVSVYVKSAGYSTSEPGTLTFYADTNGNAIAEATEIIGEPVEVASMNSGDSVLVTSESFQLPQGNWTIIIKLSPDAKPDNNEARLSIMFLDYPIIINEIMYDPPYGPEWIEIYNRSGQDSVNLEPVEVNLKGWALADAPRYDAPMLITSEDLTIQPGEYMILTYDRATFLDNFCDTCCTVFEMDGWDASIFNNDGDMVVLFDSVGTVIDSLEYPGRCSDKTVERERWWAASDDTSNWNCSQSTATPCGLNSISPAPRDLAITGLRADPENPEPLTNFEIYAKIKNLGFQESEPNSVTFYLDMDWDGYFETSENIGEVDIPELAPGEENEYSIDYAFGEGYWKILAEIGYDARTSNNQDTLLFVIGSPENRVVINEFMNKPLSDTDNPEWVELYNKSDTTVDVSGWKIGDGEDFATIFSTNSSLCVIPSGGYIIITEDSSAFREAFGCSEDADKKGHFSPSSGACCAVIQPVGSWEALNNTDDVIVLKDNFMVTQDSVAYLDDWTSECENYGISKERLDPEGGSNDPENWWCSRFGATPCEENSTIGPEISEVKIEINPNPFNPSEGEVATISYSFPMRATFTVKIYDVNGRKLKDLVEENDTPGNLVRWDGKDNGGETLPVGIYVILAKAVAEGETYKAKKAIVIAKKLD
ncbi:lamin tail domain-containing protein [bacterium]|nr:lamin tail domain-containing protein [bacterium]